MKRTGIVLVLLAAGFALASAQTPPITTSAPKPTYTAEAMRVRVQGGVAAQSAAQVTYVDASKVTELFAKPGALANGSDFTASIARRTAAGQVEIHAKETDIFYIVDGSATFVTGGTMVGGKETRPNQMLGTDITGGQTHQLKKGDFISIPAGIPHWFKEVPATGVTYYMVKVVKP